MFLKHNTPLLVQLFWGCVSFFLSFSIKKSKKKVILTSFHGRGYRGNTAVIFEALINNPSLKPVWLTRNSSLYNSLKQRFGSEHVALMHSRRGVTELLSASVVLLTHGTSDYAFLRLPRNASIIQTYHGLPTKKGEYMRPNSDKPPVWLHRKVLEYRFSLITHFLSSSEFVSDIFSKRFNLPQTSFYETGYPTYDALITSSCNKSGLKKLISNVSDSAKIILYTPTYRKRTKTKWFPFPDLSLGAIQKFLTDNDAYILLRPHPNESLNISDYENYDRFVLASQDKVEQINDLLICSDIIITDYSSTYLEGLLRDIKPIFLPYDLENYERGFPYNYDAVTPGPKSFSQKDFLIELNALLNGDDTYEADRLSVKKMFFSKTDGKSTQRVIKLIEDIS